MKDLLHIIKKEAIDMYKKISNKNTIKGNQYFDIYNEMTGTITSIPTDMAQLNHKLKMPNVFAIRLSFSILIINVQILIEKIQHFSIYYSPYFSFIN